MIDSHCHFDFAPFDKDANAYLDAAKQADVSQLIVPSVGKENWHQVRALAKQFPISVYYALGVHPLWANAHDLNDLKQLEALLEKRTKSCVAIGESGLDFAFTNKAVNVDGNKTHQVEILKKQLELAVKFDLPVILHCRKAHNEMLALLNQFSSLRGVIHAFSGSEQQGREYIKRGFYLGIGGTITYERANKTRQAVATLPLTSLLLETDAPDMPIAGFQSQPNLPEYLPIIAKALAYLKNCSILDIQKQTIDNTNNLFQIYQ